MFFSKRKKDTGPFVQTAQVNTSGIFGALSQDRQLGAFEKQLYRSLRYSIPVIDAAIHKIVRLTGGFNVKCSDPLEQELMNRFVRGVKVNGISKGLESFVAAYLDQLLTFGTAIGEIVLGDDGSIAALYNSSLDDVELRCKDNPLDVKICLAGGFGQQGEVRHPELILCSALMPEAGQLYGTSILRSLPFVSDILLKIFNAIGNNWERVGNVRFAVSYKPGEADRGFAKERAQQIAEQWSKAMKSREPQDFISVGEVSIKAIGADNQIPDCQVPVRQIMEQIVAKLGIPPFLLGLTWATTEKMSSQQADILTTELEYYRRILESMLQRVCELFMKINGCRGSFEIEWSYVDLQDEVELAKARLYNARAEEIELRCRKD